jgi:hypothetical protein
MSKRWVMRAYAVKRLLLWRYLHRFHDTYYVAAFPKSGGTWVGQMLSDCIELPFPRNNTVPKWESSVLHGHYLPSKSYKNVLVVLRDGRDCMVSLYYQFMFDNEWNVPTALQKIRSDLNFADVNRVADNLPEFIEYMHSNYLKDGYMRITWSQFVDAWMDEGYPVVRYERLLDASAEELKGALPGLGLNLPDSRVSEAVARYDFKAVSGRNRGSEEKTSFVRKGVSGDWVNLFNSNAKDIFKRHAGRQLIRAGYESDYDW